jgi:uncharacterized protein YqcC (DUF446 family)
MDNSEKYLRAASLAKQIEVELKSLNRWSDHPLPEGKFENIGAFGCNTMTFEQWIQFVLLDRLHEIVETYGEFPEDSMIATYAVKAFEGDFETGNLQNLLYQLDALVNGKEERQILAEQNILGTVEETITLNSIEIPSVLAKVIDLLPQFEGDGLESQLQTIDAFLQILHPSVRPRISSMMRNSLKEKAIDPKVKMRIWKAADAVYKGENAAAPYNHEETMNKYTEEHRKNFPDAI